MVGKLSALVTFIHKLSSARSGFPYRLSAVALSQLRSSAAVMCSLYIKIVCFIPKKWGRVGE